MFCVPPGLRDLQPPINYEIAMKENGFVLLFSGSISQFQQI
jgi:hypothetical protein